MELLLAVVGVAVLLIAAIVSLSRWLWRKGRTGRAVLAILALGVAWPFYEAVYPPESFYIAEFERLTRVSLPTDVEFIEKRATFPDWFGDYSACFVVRLSVERIAALSAQLGEPMDKSGKIDSCAKRPRPNESKLGAKLYDLAARATREDAQIYVSVAPEQNLVKISWYLW